MNAELSTYHRPVMPEESLKFLVTDASGVYVDCTLGGGGHSRLLLERCHEARVIALDIDQAALNEARGVLAAYGSRVTFLRENFRNLSAALHGINVEKVHGILADFGVSSHQFDDLGRGFSFRSANLDMRMDDRLSEDAAHLINSLDEKSLADIFFNWGEEHKARPIAAAIARERSVQKITSGSHLAAVVASVSHRRGKIHPATKVFQALRIAVNGELDSITSLLNDAPALLHAGGRAVIISYHSLEDRIVKNNFRSLAKEGKYQLLTKKVVIASRDEQRVNPRSRSAKLRAAERL